MAFHERVVVKSIKDLELTQETIRMLLDEHYQWLADELLKWQDKVKLSDCIMRSLLSVDRKVGKL